LTNLQHVIAVNSISLVNEVMTSEEILSYWMS